MPLSAGEIDFSGVELALVILVSVLTVVAIPAMVVLLVLLVKKGSIDRFLRRTRTATRQHPLITTVAVAALVIVVVILGLLQGGLSAPGSR